MRPVAQHSRIKRFAIALAITSAAFLPTHAFAQVKTPSNTKTHNESQPAGEPAAIARGQIVYKDRCAICHFSESDARKIGPGLGGIYKRGKFAGGGKVDDAAMVKWILDGGKDMPPFKPVLNPNQVRNLVTYLKTLR